MSKLDFKEEPLDDDIGENGEIKSVPVLEKDGESSVIAVESNLPSTGKPSVASTALFDLTNEETDDDSVAKTSKGTVADSSSLSNETSKPKDAFVVKTIDIEVETATDPALAAVQILSTDDQVNSNSDQSNSKVPVSNWLGRFLKTKRTVVDPNSLAPDIEPSHDTFLKEFAETYNTLNSNSKEKPSESISDDSSSDEDDEAEPGKRLSVTSQQDLALLSETDVLDLMETNGNKPEASKQLIVNLFNLPYGADVEQVRHGCLVQKLFRRKDVLRITAGLDGRLERS